MKGGQKYYEQLPSHSIKIPHAPSIICSRSILASEEVLLCALPRRVRRAGTSFPSWYWTQRYFEHPCWLPCLDAKGALDLQAGASIFGRFKVKRASGCKGA